MNERNESIFKLNLKEKAILFLKHKRNPKFPPYINFKIDSIRLANSKAGRELVNLMLTDNNFRDFLCVNLQNIVRELAERKAYEGKFLHAEGDIYNLNLFGFFDSSISREAVRHNVTRHDEELAYFLLDLALGFETELKSLKSSLNINFNSDVVNPFFKFFEIIGYRRDKITFTPNLCYVILSKIIPRDIRLFLSVWQNKTIYEKYIAEFLKKNIKDFDIYVNPFIILNKDNFYGGSIELDSMLYDKDHRLTFIECKGGKIHRNELFKFLGKVEMFERIYGIKVDRKVIVATGDVDGLFKGLPTEFISDLGIFGVEDYRKGYKDFLKFVKNEK